MAVTCFEKEAGYIEYDNYMLGIDQSLPVYLWHARPWEHSHMSVNMKCLSLELLFLSRSYTQSTPNDPFFPLSYQILHTNCKFSCDLHAFREIYKFCSNFNKKNANFGLKLHLCTLNYPHFWGSTSKKIPIFGVNTTK